MPACCVCSGAQWAASLSASTPVISLKQHVGVSGCWVVVVVFHPWQLTRGFKNPGHSDILRAVSSPLLTEAGTDEIMGVGSWKEVNYLFEHTYHKLPIWKTNKETKYISMLITLMLEKEKEEAQNLYQILFGSTVFVHWISHYATLTAAHVVVLCFCEQQNAITPPEFPRLSF